MNEENLLRFLFGTLCNRVVHDLGNPLTTIRGYAQLMEQAEEEPTKKRRSATIVEASGRMREMIDRLRQFSQSSRDLESKLVGINDCVDFVAALLSKSLSHEGISLKVIRGENASSIWGHELQLEGILHLLLTQIRDTYQKSEGGGRGREITVRTFASEAGLPSFCVEFQSTVPAGGHKVLCDPEGEKRAHLSLDLIQEIGVILKGKCVVSPDGPDRWIVTVSFPVDRRAEATDAPSPEVRKPAPVSATPAGKPTILIVDDEAELADLIANYVRDEFDTIVISEPQKAAEAIAQRRFDVILTDLRMPVISGFGILKHAREFQPGVPVVIMTGHSRSDREIAFLVAQGVEVLEKPFESRKAVLTAVMRQLKAEAPASPA